MTADRILRLEWAATALFVLTAAAAAVGPDALGVVAVAVDLLLAAAGCVVFVLALARMADRSRRDELTVAGVFLLLGCAPPQVQRQLLGALGVQVVVALATAAAGPQLAFGVLVPVLGLGLCGLWAAAAGTFPPRRR